MFDLLLLIPPFLSFTLILILSFRRFRPSSVHMLDFTCFKPHPSEKLSCSLSEMHRRLVATSMFSPESLDFQRKVLERSGLGDETYGPPALVRCFPRPDMSMNGSRMEADLVLFGALDDLFFKTSVDPSSIDVLIVNCGLFAPSPSLSSVVVNRYGMRADVKAFNLSGMGCSAGVVATDLARRLLRRGERKMRALVVTMENITQSGYTGNDRSKLLPNCIFRMGGSACILSNRGDDRKKARYELLNTVRTHMGADDAAYRSVYMEEDDAGKVGVTLSKELKIVAATLLQKHMAALGPLVLPYGEMIKFAASYLADLLGIPELDARVLCRTDPQSGSSDLKTKKKRRKLYVPDFASAFEHICVHAGGKAVLDKIQESLSLSEWHMEPSRMTLYRFGNTSSSSPWYEMAYMEAQGRVRRSHRIWQLSFGSGFKCNSAVWRATANIPTKEPLNAWTDFIDGFPVQVSSIRSLSS